MKSFRDELVPGRNHVKAKRKSEQDKGDGTKSIKGHSGQKMQLYYNLNLNH